MRNDAPALKVFQRIINQAKTNLNELCDFWNIYEKQLFFVSAIAIYDRYFIEQLSQNSKKSFNDRIIEYSYPVFIRQFYDTDFCKLPGIVHKPLKHEQIELYAKLIYSCGIIGWMQSLIENSAAGFYSCRAFLNYISVSFAEKFHWNELIEDEYCDWYASLVAQFQADEYQKLNELLPEILEKLKTGIFVWNEHFLGYSNDLETEMFFHKHALLDAQQSVAWDMFPPDCKFGLNHYGDIVQSIVDFAGYAIKHVYCAHLLMQANSGLVIEDLLNVFFLKQDLTRLIGRNCNISDEAALSILQMASLSPDTVEYYANGNARSVPFVQISEHQYLRTIKGLLDEPFDFVLYNLRKSFPEAWDKNANQREAAFRVQLYALFDDPRFDCVQHPVIIKEKSRTLTDIDAVVIDKATGEIALFQLKWQDPTDYSPFALKSKRSNYYLAAEKWLQTIEKWLRDSTNKEIASKLGIKAKYFNKEKVSIFVLGRRRGNYSGNKPYPYECAWSQWYQIIHAASYLRQKDKFTISNLYELIVKTNPFNVKIVETPVTFCYGKYRIKFGGRTFYR